MIVSLRWFWLIVGLAALTGYYYFIGRSTVFNFGDEGYLYYLSWAFGEGKLPFRDFELSSYPPGLFALYALIFKILGVSIENGRIMASLWMITNVGFSYFLVRKLSSHRLAILAAVIIGLVPGPWDKAYIGTLCLAALSLAVRIHLQNVAKDFILMGCVIGLGLQLRLDAAICASVLLFIAIWRIAPFKVLARHLALLTIAIILVMLPLCYYLGVHGLLNEYFEQLLRFASIATERNTAWYRLPAPTLSQLFNGGGVVKFSWMYYSSFLVPLVLAILAVKTFMTNRFTDTPELRITILVTFWVLMSLPQYALERPDASHLFQRGFTLVVGICFLLGRNGLQKAYDGIAPVFVSILLILVLGLYIGYGLSIKPGGGLAYRATSKIRKISLPNGMQFIELVNEPSWGKIAIEIANHSEKTDRLAAIPFSPGLNFVLKLHTPGRKIHYFPNAIRTTEEDAIAASELTYAKFIVLNPASKISPTSRAVLGCYAPIMTRFINSSFQKITGYTFPLLLIHKEDSSSESVNIIPPCFDDLPKANKPTKILNLSI